MSLTVTQLRNDIYNLLDKVAETGIAQEIERKGKKLKIILDSPKSKLDNLEGHNVIKGNPLDLANIHFDETWQKERAL
jgi:hypothetical protein